MNERARLRDWARQVAAIAASPENEAVLRRWRDVNALRCPDRPPVWCKPVGAWDELLPPQALLSSTPELRGVERTLRRILIKHEIRDDSPVTPWFETAARFRVDPPNRWGVEIGRHTSGVAGGAWGYDPPLRDRDDLARLTMPSFTLDRDESERGLARLHDLLGDILPVRCVAALPLSATLCVEAAALRGLTPLLLDMADDPDWVRRFMGFLRDACLRSMDQVEATGWLAENRHEAMTGSDPVGPVSADGTIRLANLWCLANSQEFDPVSPEMWEVYLLEFQKPILARFGLTGYGCCENLTRKIDGVLSIPNLRIFVCSAWTDLETVVDRVGRRKVIMWRQKATDVVHAPDEAALRKALRDGLDRLRGCHVQIVLRELQTLQGRLDRLHVWTRIAKEEAERFAARS